MRRADNTVSERCAAAKHTERRADGQCLCGVFYVDPAFCGVCTRPACEVVALLWDPELETHACQACRLGHPRSGRYAFAGGKDAEASGPRMTGGIKAHPGSKDGDRG